MSRTGMVGDNEHRQIISRPCSLIGRVWVDEHCLKAFHAPRVKVRSTDAAICLEENENQRRGVCAAG